MAKAHAAASASRLSELWLATILAAFASGAWAQAPDPRAPASEHIPILITNAPNTDIEDLDLGPNQGEALRSEEGCQTKLPSGAATGQRGSKSNACEERAQAMAQYALASDWARGLWCEDSLGRKAAARALVAGRLAEQKSLVDAREAAIKLEQARLTRQQSERSAPLAPLSAFMGLISGAAPKAQEKKIPIPPSPYYDPSHDSALAWDNREAGVCHQSPYLPLELGPSLALAGQGKITTPNGSCEAILVESTLLSGRHSLSRLSWIGSKCPGFQGPSAKEMDAAIAAGESAAQNWQTAHLSMWKWTGATPREAKARSADAP